MTETKVLLGRYRLEERLGAGGMGEVFRAHDTMLDRRVAVKLLPAESEADPVARERLRREALAIAALDHPFICKVYEVGESEGRAFIVMEFVDGDTLHAAAQKAPLPIRQVLDIAHGMAQADLAFVHRNSVKAPRERSSQGEDDP